MASSIKIILSSLFVLLLVACGLGSPLPGMSHQKVRIHVPVKHHTHVITKTKVKTVHIGVPIKAPRKHWQEDWMYSKKKPRQVTSYMYDDFDDNDY